MTLPYDEQLKVWAAIRYNLILQEIESVALETNYDEGYPCCGGRDPGCYCSLATSASLDLIVTINKTTTIEPQVEMIDLMFGDMGDLVKEIYEAHFP